MTLDTEAIRQLYNRERYKPLGYGQTVTVDAGEHVGHAVFDTVASLCDELDRYRACFQAIQDQRDVHHKTMRVPLPDMPEYGRGWHDGFVTALADVCLRISRAVDPEGMAKSDEESYAAAYGTDREWFERTGNCGHCGNRAEDCLCTDDDPCRCGPHPEKRTWPRPCSWCNGMGQVEPVRR